MYNHQCRRTHRVISPVGNEMSRKIYNASLHHRQWLHESNGPSHDTSARTNSRLSSTSFNFLRILGTKEYICDNGTCHVRELLTLFSSHKIRFRTDDASPSSGGLICAV